MTQSQEAFAPCPTCKQYSHTIGEDKLAEAFNHFQSMYAHPVRGHPMGDSFDEKTRDAAQVLMAAAQARSPAIGEGDVEREVQRIAPQVYAAICPDGQYAGEARAAYEEVVRQTLSRAAVPKAIGNEDGEAVERLLEALDGWERAYPLSAFPEPDLKRAAAVLKAEGMTLDAISASNMRHVVSQLSPLIHAALSRPDEMRKALEELATEEEAYRACHDMHGDGHPETGRSWDLLRRAGDKARQLLAQEQAR